jgi:hypothetical protein
VLAGIGVALDLPTVFGHKVGICLKRCNYSLSDFLALAESLRGIAVLETMGA